MGALDKIKEFVSNFAKSEEAQNELKSTVKVQNWLQNIKLEVVPKDALDELLELVEIAEDKARIALVDLLRLLIVHEGNAAHLLNKHWDKIDLVICSYL